MSFTPFLQGFGISAGLIMAIGAQNAHVLSLGIKRQHPFAVALICSLCDALLIIAGVLGMGMLLAYFPQFALYARWGGALFLAAYGLLALRSALAPKGLEPEAQANPPSFKLIIATTLMVTLLNTQVYLDTLVLIGTVGSQFREVERLVFTSGAVLASFIWFFSLAWGARKLSPWFKSPHAWRILDLLVAAIMLTLAASLLLADH